MQAWIDEMTNLIGILFSRHTFTLFMLCQIEAVSTSAYVYKSHILETVEEFVEANRGPDNTFLEFLAMDSRGRCREPVFVQYASIMLIALFVRSGEASKALENGNVGLAALHDFYLRNKDCKEAEIPCSVCLGALAYAGIDLSVCYGIQENTSATGKINWPECWIKDGNYFGRLQANHPEYFAAPTTDSSQ